MAFNFPSVQIPKDINHDDWYDWKWQLKAAIKTQESLQKILDLTPAEVEYFKKQKPTDFKFQITRYSAEVIKQKDSNLALRQILIGTDAEYVTLAQSQLDPLNERNNNPVARVIHRYSDRALFLVTDYCGVYCRYCTRKHFTAKDQAFPNQSEYEEALNYFRKHKGIKEVILSGGDPLTLSDEKLIKVISDLRTIPHIELIRIGTRTPVILPMRITDKLVNELKRFHPVFIMTHFNHPDELTLESSQALLKFVDNGFPVFNQMVLLNGINNDAALVQALSRRLLYLRVKPYYMFQCDPSEGTDHLRTSIPNSMKIQKELWGHLSGLAMPNLSVDIPSGGGKAYLVPNFVESISKDQFVFKGWDGVKEKYINPQENSIKMPFVAKQYLNEWTEILNSKK